MIHTVEVKWHDLIEDPNDLPKTKDSYLVTLINKETEEVDAYSGGMGYDPEHKVWCEVYDDGYGDYGGIAYFESFNTPADDSFKPDDLNKNWVVVAWAEIPKNYIPQKKQA